VKAHIGIMADGYLIEVTTPQKGGGAPVKAMWYAHIPGKDEALDAVRDKAGAAAGATVSVVKPLTHLILTEVNVPEGEVMPYE
jgi:hypothetical protein